MKEEKLRVVLMDAGKLKPYPRNPRRNDAAVSRMVAAISEYGFRIPVVAKSDGTVVDGHLRLKAALELGMKKIPVALADNLSDAQVKAFRLLANQSANWAEWDTDLLRLELEDLQALDADIDSIGFSEDFLEDLLKPPKADSPYSDSSPGALAREFGVPPFSVLSMRDGWWQERKWAWIDRGIDSGEGREGRNLLKFSRQCAVPARKPRKKG